ncbi:integrase arm-type DNA-binding domain-containing protein [Pantoea stewartii]|uniref:CP4-57 family phage integrase n=1 Tax=Pantoea stewartii subsp. stewartii DC283 TaxID=660596 RepID=H3RBK3_PANSE|nr:integrase arm-type DNA-binding domain-containing protein [Pantoea stewartii]ARF51890.1 hypothetical protein DSJ_10030 [Pantoea stewartii subsp. stewartii DC283]EHU01342.1 CP4-57 family phage integrase [Pantoea stewartii subsp. stewartii DC283]
MPKKTRPLTNVEVKSAKSGTADYALYDGDGLLICIKSTGSKIWRVRYSHPRTGKRQTLTVGNFPYVSLIEARKARESARELLRNGIDPQEEKRRILRERQDYNGNTLRLVAEQWFRLKKDMNRSDSLLKQIERSINFLNISLGDIPVGDITPRMALSALSAQIDKGLISSARVNAQRLNEIMNYAMNTGLISANQLSKIGNAIPEAKKNNLATIRPEEFPSLLSAIESLDSDEFYKMIVHWQFLTMTRPIEGVRAEWSEIDFVENTWTIPAHKMKKKRVHVVPLSTQALDILSKLRPVTGNKKYVFNSFIKSSQPVFKGMVNELIVRTEFKGKLTSHGLRSVASVALNEEGFNPDVIEAALAHVGSDAVRNAYNRTTYLEQRRKMMQWLGDFFDKAQRGERVDNDGTRGLKLVV